MFVTMLSVPPLPLLKCALCTICRYLVFNHYGEMRAVLWGQVIKAEGREWSYLPPALGSWGLE